MDSKAEHPLAIRENIREVRAEGREFQLFWLKAHIGTAGNERPAELAKTAALRSDTPPDFDKALCLMSKKGFETNVFGSGTTDINR
ncbi:hypothetical protein EVAR_78112_1 [Eumeta japonica]|uniref:Uncharacterized protein n=1 Tax=Eumeta variegata TaxID=151549 RepID=A0A4C1T338_EUMVA|nr:hypothetical protein EVAR_78112_1 [Eumeta japonica]